MSVNLKVGTWVDGWVRAISRQQCFVCAEPGSTHAICRGCHEDLPWNRTACPGCAQAMPHPALCRDCLRRPPAFDQAFAPFLLQGVVRQWVHGLKYQARFHQARLLAELLSAALPRDATSTLDRILPVPVRFGRRMARGYNQCTVLASHVSRALDLPLQIRGVRMIRQPAEQIGQSAAQRHRNLRGAFSIECDLTGQHVALLDDVMTTGATLEALALAARKAGAARVTAWALARTP